ncbi:MAG: hypothetical protein J1F04_01550 [Oscillospiraceae bacterium]|nr:hypothetical protein [Oscillospiraceae bacterium]
MTIVNLIDDLKIFCENAVKHLKLPTAVSKGDTEQIFRPPTGYKMRLPDGKSADKFVPYFIVQFLNSNHIQKPGEKPKNTAVVRFIFCVWNNDAQEGGMALLNFMETVRLELLRKVNVSEYFKLDVNEPLEGLAYPDNTAPFFAGEMIGTFELPPIQREVEF